MGSLGRVLPGRGTIFQLWDPTLAAAWGWEAGTPAAGFQAGGDRAVTELGRGQEVIRLGTYCSELTVLAGCARKRMRPHSEQST